MRQMIQLHRPSDDGIRLRALGRLLPLASVLLALASPGLSRELVRGDWRIELERSGRLFFRMEYRFSSRDGGSHNGNSVSTGVDPSSLGLTRARVVGPSGPARFELRREAGTLVFVGQVGGGEGSGTFDVRLNPEFAAELERRGYERPTEEQQLHLTLHNFQLAFLDELSAQGYDRPTTAKLVELTWHGVDLEYLRGMGAKGYRLRTVAELQRFRDHGVDLDFIEGLAELGHRALPAEEVIRAWDHGVDGKFVGGLVREGYRLSLSDLVTARDHGVDPAFVRGLRRAGLRGLTLRQLVRARDHGVDGEYLSRAGAQLHPDVSIEEWIERRDRGE